MKNAWLYLKHAIIPGITKRSDQRIIFNVISSIRTNVLPKFSNPAKIWP